MQIANADRAKNLIPSNEQATHAFGIVFRISEGCTKYLLVKPSDGGDIWVLPKGHLEKHEGHGEAAQREVYEETGVRARIMRCLGAVSYATPQEERVRGKGYLMEFVCQDVAPEARNPQWFSVDELTGKYLPEETRFLLKLAEMRLGEIIES
jgi:8-oxo-dGTP pyrophosphatase MutT (NUDIX family)